MNKFLSFLLHPLTFGVIGILALSALVWWVGPLISFGESQPLGSTGVRLAVIGVIVLLFVLRLVYGAWKRKRTNAALLQGMAAGPSAADREMATLNERFAQAVQTLKTAPSAGGRSRRGGQQFLYELPWYMFIGAPGSGKTTALLNAGLTFPLAEKLGQGAVKGVGGTRNCDWWFTDEAVLIDTAGRYTTQESDSDTDAAAWDGFLALLKKTRPRRPINGVLLTVNIQDLLQQTPADRKEHAAKLRARIQELHAKLGVRPPVYVLVTKIDLLAGFNETFGELGKEERDQVWGFSFTHNPHGSDDPLGEFPSEFAALEKRLRDRLLDRIETEREVVKRSAIFTFPQQFAGLKGLLGGFLEQVFSGGGSLEERPVLRGVYFTSGTQEGTPIDRVMGTLARTFGVERRLSQAGGARGKSFFLHRLLKNVVFTEQGLVGENRAIEGRRRKLRLAAVALIALLGVALVAGWLVSFGRNKSYVGEIDARLPDLKQAVAGIPPATNGDVTPLPGVLTQVRGAAVPEGFPIDAPPFFNALGLYQGDKLDAGAGIGYSRLLDHALMPRVARRLEERLRAVNRDNLELAYEALKHYLMLYSPEHFDAETLKAWITLDWDVNLANRLTPEQRTALGTHLDAALARGAPKPLVPMDQTLVDSVRQMLAAYPLEYRIYSRIKRANLATGDWPEFSVASGAGPQAAQVFERASGEPLTRGIPGFFTKQGFKDGLGGGVEKAALQMAGEEAWVMGRGGSSAADQAARAKDIALNRDLTDRVRRLYFEDYIKTWDAYLADVRLVKLAGIDRSLQVARVLAAVDSPLKAWLRAVTRETTLVETAGAAASTDTVAGKIGERTDKAKREMSALMGAQPAPSASSDGGPLEKMVDDHFAPIHRLVQGQPAPIDDVMKLFNEVYVQLAAVDAAQKSKSAPPPPGGGAAAAKAAAGLQPEPIKSMLEALADAGSSQSQAAERQSLTSELKPVTDFCNRAVSGRYPFAPGSQADVMPEDFGQLFGQGGMLDDFYQRKLATLVDTGTNPWAFKPLPDGSRPVAPAALADFQRAARIKEVFFRSGGKAPSFRVDVRAVEWSDNLKEMTLDVDGQLLKFTPGNTTPYSVTWPSQRVASSIKMTTVPASTLQNFDGPWALFRLFDRYEVQNTAQPEKFAVIVIVDGKRVRLEVTASSVFNPFRLREIQQFRCPGAL